MYKRFSLPAKYNNLNSSLGNQVKITLHFFLLILALAETSFSVSARAQNQRLDPAIQNKSKSDPDSRIRCRPLLTWPPQYSLDEILARMISLVVEATIFGGMIIFAVDPNRPQHLYSVLPPEYKNVYSYLGLLAAEGIFMTMMSKFVTLSIICQLLFFGKCQAEFKRLVLQLR